MLRDTTSEQRIFFMNCIGSLFSYYDGDRTRTIPPIMAQSITVPDLDMDAENRKDEFHYVFPNGDTIPCKDCKLEVFVNEFGYEFHRELETKDFVFFINREEGDEYGNTIMFKKNEHNLSLNCVSDNYFAFQGFMQALANEEHLFVSKYLQEGLKVEEFQEDIECYKE